MYIGRFVVVGRTAQGEGYLGYRVSSRSFPNRYILTRQDRAVVLPTADAPLSDNPYISYNCLRTHAGTTVVSNGSHVDPIIDKVKAGYGLRDAMTLALLALDYEHDQLNTPRIAAGLDASGRRGFLGIVAEDKVCVRAVAPEAGQAYLIATYELTEPTPITLGGFTTDSLCDAIFESEYDFPVASLAVMAAGQELRMAARSVR
ncbi:MAG: IMP cyclohydrolase [Anaerolineae bacterium]